MPLSPHAERRLDEIRGAGPRRVPGVRVLAAFAQNTNCRVATLGFAAGVDFDRLLAGTRYRAPFGQSPFAIGRGLAFEKRLREDGHAAALELLCGPLGLPPGAARVVNLREGFPSGPGKSAARAAATSDLLRKIVTRAADAPHLIDGAVLSGAVGGLDAHFEADSLASRALDGQLRVVEVKSFPKVDDRVDPEQLGAALDQVAVYTLLLCQTVEALGADLDRFVSDRGLLITPRNVGLTPALSEARVASRVARVRRVFAGLPDAADVAAATPAGLTFGAVADATAEEQKRLDALHDIADRIGTAYTPNCLATCGSARFCRDRAVGAGSPCVTGTAAVRLLPGGVALGRAEALTRGAEPTPAEAPAAALLARAGRLIEAHYRPLLRRAWDLLWRCRDRELARPEAPSVGRRCDADRQDYTWHIDWLNRNGLRRTRQSPRQAALALRTLEEAGRRLEAEEACDDPLRMAGYVLANKAVRGRVVAVDPNHKEPGPKKVFRRPLVTLRSPDPCLMPVGRELWWAAQPDGTGYVVEDVSACPGGGSEVVLKLTTSTATRLPAAGTDACFSVHSTKSRWLGQLPDEDPWTHLASAPPAAPAPIEDANLLEG